MVSPIGLDFEKKDNKYAGIAKNNDKKDGIIIIEIGIKILRVSSNVSEIAIQYKLNKK